MEDIQAIGSTPHPYIAKGLDKKFLPVKIPGDAWKVMPPLGPKYICRYAIDPKAPRLKGPIGPIDILEARLNHPHPAFYDSKDGRTLTNDINIACHSLQCAAMALERGYDDEIVTALFLHDWGKPICVQKHSWIAAQMIRPYVSERVAWLVDVHYDIEALIYNEMPWYDSPNFEGRINLDLEAIKNSPWFKDGVKVREIDEECRAPLKSPNVIEDVKKILDKTFKLPKKGLAYDDHPFAGFWKIIVEPNWMT